jgi:hypothetical protein
MVLHRPIEYTLVFIQFHQVSINILVCFGSRGPGIAEICKYRVSNIGKVSVLGYSRDPLRASGRSSFLLLASRFDLL